jgi:hypothetical protein
LNRKDEDYILVDFAQSFPQEVINSVVKLQEKCAEVSNQEDIKNKHVWVQLPVISVPNEVTSCPGVKTLRSLLADESLIMSIYSHSGYSFSSEYIYVYKGTFRSMRAYDDLLGVLQHAIQSCNSSLADPQALSYAQHIIQYAAWIANTYLEVIQYSLQQCFPGILSLQLQRQYQFELQRIYIGHGRYTIRIENTIRFLPLVPVYKLICYVDGTLDDLQVFQDHVSSRASDGSRPSPSISIPSAMMSRHRYYLVLAEGEAAEALATDSFVADVTAKVEMLLAPHLSSEAGAGELFGWGLDAYRSLGLAAPAPAAGAAAAAAGGGGGAGSEQIYTPRPIPLRRSLQLERVRMIACSSRHSLLLTGIGRVYACGDNAEGALGVNDLQARYVPTCTCTHTHTSIPPSRLHSGGK